MAELLPWLNLLLLPCVGLLMQISSRLARLESTQDYHAARLQKLDGIQQS